MKGMLIALTAAAFAVTCSVSKEQKMDLLDVVKKEATDVALESKGFGSQAEEVEKFIHPPGGGVCRDQSRDEKDSSAMTLTISTASI